MEFDLIPRNAQKIFEGGGGEYYSWMSSDFALLSESKVGGGRLVLKPRGFALPHYADSAKVGFVLQGTEGLVGMVLPKAPNHEVVIKVKKGDVIPVPLGAVSWWFNGGDSQLDIVFLGDTTTAHLPGNFSYFFLSGAFSMLGGFSTEFITTAYCTDTNETNKLLKSQTGVLIIKLDETKILPKPHQNDDASKGMVYNTIDSHLLPDFCVENGGFWAKVTKSEFPFLGQVGLSANHVKLEANAMTSPVFTTDSTVQVIYVGSGGGRIQIVGFNGKPVLDADVKAGHLLVVPKFFVAVTMAGGEGMECFSVITSSEPALQDLASKASVLVALSPETLRESFNVAADFEEHLLAKLRSSSIIFPSKEK